MGCGIAIIKYLVFIFNLVFAIIGVALLVIGVIFKLDIDVITKSLDESFIAAPTLLIAVGSFIFIISFFGCCGAIKESNCMLITYAVCLIIILILQIAIGIFAFMVIRNTVEIEVDVKADVTTLFNEYNATMEKREELDELQEGFKCCGINGPDDFKDGPVPHSCCIQPAEKCFRNSEGIYEVGCVEKVYKRMILVVRSVGYAVFAVCVIEFIGILFAFCLTNSMKNQYRRGAYA